MAGLKSIPVRLGQGYVGVKEEYNVVSVRGTNDIKVKILMCVDANMIPCRLCFASGNSLKPVRGGSQVDLATMIKGRAGIYSRLDCVNMIVKLQGTATVRETINQYTGAKVRELVWHNNPVTLYTPIGLNNDSLVIMNVAQKLTAQRVLELSQIVVRNLVAMNVEGGNPVGDTILLTKQEFIKNRI